MKTSITLLLGIISIAFFGGAQTSAGQKDPILGIWKGTSLCQVKNSSCNDEIVVCHISKGSAVHTYKFVMNKMVNNAEVSMGELEFIYDEAKSSLTCHSVSRYDSFWKFDVKQNTMDGTLTVDHNTLFRVIKLVKT